MLYKELYEKSIERNLNPVVNAENLDAETVKTEIEEYVFTEEILNGLYKILNAVRKQNYNHDGIWINGYFGSGKSHFIKYLNYSISPAYSDKAFARFVEAVDELGALANLEFTLMDAKDLAEWYKKAQVDTILFNIGQVSNYKGDAEKVFLNVFWNEFNKFRGYNKFNLALAQFLEKELDEAHLLEEFKAKIRERKFDWDKRAEILAITKLDMVLEVAKQVMPELSIDTIREKIKKNDVVLSVDSFTKELSEFLEDKGANYRLVFLVDEVSQFINDRKGLLLQLQSIVERLHTDCKDKVWVACTAQQDLSEIVDSCKISQTSDDYGKIMGRFEVRMALKGATAEFITQKRILEKNLEGEKVLRDMYTQKKNALMTQFQLPTIYKAYDTIDDFVNYYPFVPYQLQLITKVFDAFVEKGFVDAEVKGNERSVIKVTYNTAQLTKNDEIGHFITFDQFFQSMFQNVLMAKGQKALDNAAKLALQYPGDTEFAKRVVNVLFMVANLKDSERLVFKSTVDNISTLLMKDVDAQKLALREEVQKVLQYLCDHNAIRKETDKSGDEFYLFYNEIEMEVANLIKMQKIDNSYMADILKDEIFKYQSVANKEQFVSRSFSICAELFTRTYLTTNNPDIKIEYVFDKDDAANAETYALTNRDGKLAFYLADFYNGDSKFKSLFYHYCQTRKYLRDINPADKEHADTHAKFSSRADSELQTKLLPLLHSFLDKCPVVSGTGLIGEGNLGAKGGKDRYKAAIKYHLSTIYTEAALVAGYPTEGGVLASKIKRPLEQDAMGIGPQLGKAEAKLDTYLQRKGHPCIVKDVVHTFGKAPYGWNEVCTLYALNELVRTKQYEFSYNNIPRVEPKTVAELILKNQEKFEIAIAEAIPVELVANFLVAWKECFNEVEVGGGNDANAIFDFCTKDEEKSVQKVADRYRELEIFFGHRPFVAKLNAAVAHLDVWKKIRDPREFFEAVIADKDEMSVLLGECRQLEEFKDGQYDKYLEVLRFIKENAENLSYLTDDAATVVEIKQIKDDDWPMGKLRIYLKQKKELAAKIDELREKLKGDIKAAYEAAYEDLHKFGEALKVENMASLLPDMATAIQFACQKNSLDGLKNELHEVEAFKLKYQNVLAQQVKPVEPPPAPDGKVPPVAPPVRKPKVVKVNVHSGTQLHTEADVDEYLKRLRDQLMEHVNDSEYTIIQ
jgi:hypothetical protein